MNWIDVAIPGIGGLLLAFAPALFIRSAGDLDADARNIAKFRRIGVGLLIVAGVYALIKFASQ